MTTGLKAVVLALLAGGVAVSSALGAAHLLRQRALRTSHQQPTPELWVERATTTTPQLVVQGRKTFVTRCAHCHGIDARGDEGPDLHDVQVSDRYIANTILRGIPHEMPSFAKQLKPDDISALTAYVRSLE
jgi:mono/diheme cytochrome c family protein